jgi:tRNA nucleotidyltransferase/poly(A) polymerase
MLGSVFRHYPEVLQAIRQQSERTDHLYLVGGSVRDAFLGQSGKHDLDFVLEAEKVKTVARRVADHLHGAFFMLDDDRQTARVIVGTHEGPDVVLDFSAFRADGLEEDLRGRDFTINAMAVDIFHPDQVIDPLGGAQHLHDGQLVLCSPSSFLDDPVRILRAIRLTLNLELKIDKPTYQLMQQAVIFLANVSVERQRDEIFRLFSGKKISTAVRLMQQVGVLPIVFPELVDLRGVQQSSPHVLDVWDHTLAAVQELEKITQVLTGEYIEGSADNFRLGMATMLLGRFRQNFTSHLNKLVCSNRSVRELLFLGALYHDVAKPIARQINEDGRIRFFEHDLIGGRIMAERAHAMALSQAECRWLSQFVAGHMQVNYLVRASEIPDRRAIYRFFHELDELGVDVCLFSMADVLATYRTTLPQERWKKELDTCRALLEAWWEKTDIVRPVQLIKGDDLIDELSLESGPVIGELLEYVRELQAVGEISTRQQALDRCRQWLHDYNHDVDHREDANERHS